MTGTPEASASSDAPKRQAPEAGRVMERLVRASFTTEESVYGVILVAGMIVVAGSHASSSWEVFWTVIITVVVFWAAHVYAGTVAHHGFSEGHEVSLGEAFRISMRKSFGLLASAAIPSLILLLGATEVVDDATAVWTALWAGVAVLAILGWIAFSRRKAPLHLRILGSLTTAAFGLVMVVLKVFVH